VVSVSSKPEKEAKASKMEECKISWSGTRESGYLVGDGGEWAREDVGSQDIQYLFKFRIDIATLVDCPSSRSNTIITSVKVQISDPAY
jgi:hypothetical protein